MKKFLPFLAGAAGILFFGYFAYWAVLARVINEAFGGPVDTWADSLVYHGGIPVTLGGLVFSVFLLFIPLIPSPARRIIIGVWVILLLTVLVPIGYVLLSQ